MEIEGKIIKILPVQSGAGKNGIWKKREFVIETAAQIPRKICFTLWGDKTEQFNVNEGEDAEVSFDLESREFNNKWYTEAKAWKIVKKSPGQYIPSGEEPPPAYSEFPQEDGVPF
jgi:hypothetical protein